jgi:hypothetical protein
VVLTFDGSTVPATVTAKAAVSGLKTADVDTLTISGLVPGKTGDILVQQVGSADADGKASFEVKLAVPAGYATIMAQLDSSDASTPCSTAAMTAGCTTMTIPGYVSATQSRAFPAPSVTVEPGDGVKPASILVEATLSGLAPAEPLEIVVMAYVNATDPAPTALLRQGVLPDQSGKASLKSKLLVPDGTAWIAVQILGGRGDQPSCDPSTSTVVGEGCTLLRLV